MPPERKSCQKSGKKREKSGKGVEIEKKRRNRVGKAKIGGGSFTLPLLANRADYATAEFSECLQQISFKLAASMPRFPNSEREHNIKFELQAIFMPLRFILT